MKLFNDEIRRVEGEQRGKAVKVESLEDPGSRVFSFCDPYGIKRRWSKLFYLKENLNAK